MFKVFVEYQILPQHRSAYSRWIKNVMGIYPELELLEGADQPGLFVELWSGLTREDYDKLKKLRLGDMDHPITALKHLTCKEDVRWRDMHGWVKGGAEKIQIWYFNKVR
jgi:hypothetical protein